jgi:hypothetical protein
MNYPPVGIGILNWNGRNYLEQFLPYLQGLSYPGYTVYVIDTRAPMTRLHLCGNTILRLRSLRPVETLALQEATTMRST